MAWPGAAAVDVTAFVAVASVLVIAHEFGHYLAARATGVRVSVFSLGFGPELFGRRDRRGTRWKLCAVPLGGYVRMIEADEADGTAGGSLRKILARRAAIAAAGPFANLLFAVLLTAALIVVADPAQHAPPGIAEAIARAVCVIWHIGGTTARQVGEAAAGMAPLHHLSGPIRLAQLSGAVARRGVAMLIGLTAILSVNLGLTNLLPIPSLDGGHLVLCLAEAMRGRPLSPRTHVRFGRAGLGFLASLLLLATCRDLAHLGVLGLL